MPTTIYDSQKPDSLDFLDRKLQQALPDEAFAFSPAGKWKKDYLFLLTQGDNLQAFIPDTPMRHAEDLVGVLQGSVGAPYLCHELQHFLPLEAKEDFPIEKMLNGRVTLEAQDERLYAMITADGVTPIQVELIPAEHIQERFQENSPTGEFLRTKAFINKHFSERLDDLHVSPAQGEFTFVPHIFSQTTFRNDGYDHASGGFNEAVMATVTQALRTREFTNDTLRTIATNLVTVPPETIAAKVYAAIPKDQKDQTTAFAFSYNGENNYLTHDVKDSYQQAILSELLTPSAAFATLDDFHQKAILGVHAEMLSYLAGKPNALAPTITNLMLPGDEILSSSYASSLTLEETIFLETSASERHDAIARNFQASSRYTEPKQAPAYRAFDWQEFSLETFTRIHELLDTREIQVSAGKAFPTEKDIEACEKLLQEAAFSLGDISYGLTYDISRDRLRAEPMSNPMGDPIDAVERQYGIDIEDTYDRISIPREKFLDVTYAEFKETMQDEILRQARIHRWEDAVYRTVHPDKVIGYNLKQVTKGLYEQGVPLETIGKSMQQMTKEHVKDLERYMER